MNTPSLHELLEDLLSHTYDSYEGYHEAAQQVEKINSALARYFQARSLERYQFVEYLYKQVAPDSEIPTAKINTSLEGDIHRIWMRIKTFLDQNDTRAVLQECLRGEQVLQSSYEDVLADDRLDANLIKTLEAQIENVKKNIHDIEVMYNMQGKP